MSLLTKPEDLKQNVKFKGLIYGQPGIGKSTLALSAPNPVVIDADNGMSRVEPHLRVPSLQVSSYAQILELLNSEELAPFETIVFDTIGAVLEFMEPYLIKQNPKNAKSNGTLSLQGYGERKRTFNALVRTTNEKGKNILFVAHEKEEKDGENKVIRPDIPGSSGADIIKILDFVGYMEAKGAKRTISFAPTDRYYAKNSLQLDEVLLIPDTKNGNTFISEKIVKMTKDRLSEQAKLREQYNDIIKHAQQTILSNKDLNDAVEALKAFDEIWDSKRQIWHFLSNYAQENGWEYDKQTKMYQKPLKDSPAADNVQEYGEEEE